MNTTISSPEDAARLNRLQDAVLDAIRTARDEIDSHFVESGHPEDPVDQTFRRLFAYLSDRSQTVSYLVSSGFVWDGEIVLRSFYEANAKIWFICFREAGERKALVDEFWGAFSAAHNRKHATRARAPVELFRSINRPIDEAILSALTSENLFDFGTDAKETRKRLEQKWSFSEILKYLAANSPAEFEMKYIEALSHAYGIASHLIHADESALNLMLDRKLRPPDELAALAKAHVCRIFSDQVSLWILSAVALSFRFGRQQRISKDLENKFALAHRLSKPFVDAFEVSQLEFYSR